MRETYPELRVENLYGQWIQGRREVMASMQPVAAQRLSAYFQRYHLVQIEETRFQTANDTFGNPEFAVIVAEARAAGLAPEKRLPQGWRRWFCAP